MPAGKTKIGIVAALTLVLSQAPAHAWTRQGHMVIAAIAFEELKAEGGDELIQQLAALMDAHPDKGPFDVAAGRATGEDRVFRMFLECSRWSDDVRETVEDRPSWHGEMRYIFSDRAALMDREPHGVAGAAYALNLETLQDTRLSLAERSRALCWIEHLAGDIHQPLHVTQMITDEFPDGDRGGGRSYVVDPVSQMTVTFHWFWDDLIHREDDLKSVRRRASELVRSYPRAVVLAEGAGSQFEDWGRESFEYARTMTYRTGYPAGGTWDIPEPVPADYLRDAQALADLRGAQAGYRLADEIRAALEQ